jgi:hypothetical protein
MGALPDKFFQKGDGVRLCGEQLESLAELVQILLCGEASAALAFEVLARQRRRQGDAPELIDALQRIADDEHEHEQLLLALQRRLPRPSDSVAITMAGTSFFRSLATRDAGEHFTRIAALDSAVCIILSSMRMSQPLLYAGALQRIHCDEARHVATAVGYARRLSTTARRTEQAAATRHGLTELLRPRAHCLEALQVDPDRLLHRLRQPPRSLTS